MQAHQKCVFASKMCVLIGNVRVLRKRACASEKTVHEVSSSIITHEVIRGQGAPLVKRRMSVCECVRKSQREGEGGREGERKGGRDG